ncbi:MAG TPA: 50S ribosomal protein L6 [Longimicrobiaceae bacterium]|jgi:large subunit ribosomal protein L6|nr:50S ribosomal protein L6 [Longimicrobiaceae bacterium]
MSRIGRKPISVPSGVEINIDGQTVSVRGPKGELSRTLHREVIVRREGAEVLVERPSDSPEHRSLHGLSRTLVANMVEGVTTGFTKILEIVGVGYRAETKPFGLTLALGYSHPIDYRAPEGIALRAINPTTVEVAGSNKEVVGQVAAEIRSLRPPEPYKGKGVKYQGEVIRRKAGKAGGK